MSLAPNESGLFYAVAFFYQIDPAASEEARGGNRTELILDGHDLYYRMLPQVDLMHCGTIEFK